MAQRKKYRPHENSNKEYESNLNDFRLAAGLTVQEVADAVGTHPGTIAALNNGMTAPIDAKTGEIKEVVLRIGALFNAELSDIWPRYFCSIKESGYLDEQILYSFHPTFRSFDPAYVCEQFDNLYIARFHIKNALPNKRQRHVFIAITLGEVGLEELSCLYRKSRQYIHQVYRKAAYNLKKYKQVNDI